MRTLGGWLRSGRAWLALILAAGLLHGALYVFLVPLWQHYDEPTHFEYAWLVANRPGLPQPGDSDQAMRRQVAQSMLDSGFFRNLDFAPYANGIQEPIWIGISELRHPPLYYLIASVPLRLVPAADVGLQLRLSRLVSLLFFLATIAATWATTTLLTGPGSPSRILVPLSVAMLPGLADLMTSVNNDVAAVATFSWFIWAALRLLLKPFRANGLLAAVLFAGLAAASKTTGLAAVPLLALALAMLAFRGRWRLLLWAGAATLVALTAAFGLVWDDAAYWYRNTTQDTSTSAHPPGAPPGGSAIRLDAMPDTQPPLVFQLLPTDDAVALRGRTVTLGAWMWASEPVRVITPQLYWSNAPWAARVADIGPQPTFHAYTITVAANSTVPRIYLQPLQSVSKATTVYYSGLVLAEGSRPLSTPPQYSDVSAGRGNWGDSAFRNLARNPSGEQHWPSVRPQLQPLFSRFYDFNVPASMIVDSPFDLSSSGWYYRAAAANMLRTFWAKFGWGNILLLGDRPYVTLLAVTVLGMAGAAVALVRRRRNIPWDAVLFLGATLALVWGSAMARGLHSLIWQIGIPGARYAFPAIIPTMLVLAAGWWQLLTLAGRPFRLSIRRLSVLYLLAFVALDVYAVVSLVVRFAAHLG